MITLEMLLPQDWLEQLPQDRRQLPVTVITSDSRQVRPGAVFVAVRGVSQDGHQFMNQAQEQGAVLILGQDPAPQPALRIPYLQVPDSRLALARLAANFYDNPSHQMLMVGVTGTSGKTTTSYIIESIFKAAGYEVGLIGTVAFRYQDKILESTHTTPGAPELQRMLAEMMAGGCTAVVMEVSSHALQQHRAAYLAFDAMVFTNLTPEHLDFHPDMEDYYRSKAILFTDYAEEAQRVGKTPVASISVTDEFGRRLLAETQKNKVLKALSYSAESSADLSGQTWITDSAGIRGTVRGISIASDLAGGFNISNILAAVGVGIGLNLNPEAISHGITALKLVPGRLERVENQRGVHVFVDYAHKSDALEKVLHVLRKIRGAYRLITVFGCGGDRDRTKRPVMGRLAVELSDHVVITSDNPRTEDPRAIIEEILAGVQGHSNFEVEPDRRKAIVQAIQNARKGDIVLIAGKGHEDYQIIGKTKIHFDDREVARDAFRE